MKALVIADPNLEVPPKLYGGTERIVDLVCKGLSDQGWTVDLLAAIGSQKYSGKLYSYKPPTLSKLNRAYRKIYFQLLSLWASRKVDVVISFGRVDYLWSLARTKIPLVVCFQNPVKQFELNWIVNSRQKKVQFIGISKNQMAQLEPKHLIEIVYNGVDLSLYPFSANPADPPYVLFLGRLTENKGVHLAIQAAKLAGVKIIIAGNLPSKERGAQEYFEREIKPRLGAKVEWIGPVDDATKSKLLSGAKALLFPIQWPEPFGIVMAEAFACGCPVIGWRNGSVPEVVTHNRTGFIVESIEQMVESIQNIETIDRKECRLEAERRFSQDKMLDGYLDLITKLLEQKHRVI